MIDNNDQKTVIGSAESVRFSELANAKVHARIDSGARTSAIWGEVVNATPEAIEVAFFGDDSKTYVFTDYGRQAVATSTGHIDKRYTVRLAVVVKNRKIRATFTIANRSTQVYPVLIGRNVLRGKFVVDVVVGSRLKQAESKRRAVLNKIAEEDDI